MPLTRRAMVFAAGEGRRMLPLTATTPKPLLPLGDSHLIGANLKRLAAAGITEVIINTAYLGEQIQAALGDGHGWGLRIVYSPEPFPLETGGALWQALPLLGEEPFVLLNADVLCDYPLAKLCRHELTGGAFGHLILVPNPEQHSQGDFALNTQGLVLPSGSPRYTFSGISLLHPNLVRQFPNARQVFPLREALSWAMQQGRITGEVYEGHWLDVGTPARLAAAQVLWAELCGDKIIP
ncbi:MAG TPA: nucleotidyltransferase family protein [Cellvibrionaceae bacterium]|nr:nucleotidyltransferase family protein [Cellvibrionaceae bacterium]HNG59318.1 nucleotidyltransferase family protein [Cellvibrionaceae bacterium]